MKSLAKYNYILFLRLPLLAVALSSCHSPDKEINNLATEEVKPPPPPVNHKNTNYLSEDTLESYITTASTFTLPGKQKSPFDKIVFNKVIAYDYEGSEEPYPSVFDRNNKFVPVIEKQKALNARQTEEVIDLLTSPFTYGGVTAACFDPHLAIVFYNNEDPVFITDICLDCNYLLASKEIPAMELKKINKGTENEYSAIGFSEKGRSRIKQLGKKLDFSYGRIE